MPKYLEKISSMIQYLFSPCHDLQEEICFLTMYSLELLKITMERGVNFSNLPAGPAVVSSPGQSKFTCADHTHCGSGIRDPDGSLWSKRTNFLFIFRVSLWNNNFSLPPCTQSATESSLFFFFSMAAYNADGVIKDVGWMRGYYSCHSLMILWLAIS